MKLGDKLDRPGQVPPKALKTIVNAGSYFDDAIAVEYIGGVLASSRTEVGRDDRGSRIAKMIDSLSVFCKYERTILSIPRYQNYLSDRENSFTWYANRKQHARESCHFKDILRQLRLHDKNGINRQILSHIVLGFDARSIA